MITLTLPWPISSNRYWRSYVVGRRAMVVLSPEAKAFKAETLIRARRAGIETPIAGRVALTIGLYPALPKDAARRMRRDPTAWDDTVRSIDLDNALKVLIDALKDVVIEDDKWVRRIVAERFEPDGEARVVVKIEPIDLSSPQLAIDVPPQPNRPCEEKFANAPIVEWVDPMREVAPLLDPFR